MGQAHTTPPATAPAKTPVKEPAQTNPLRLGILLGVLVVVLILLGHHYLIAHPATQTAYDNVQTLFNKRNALGVTGADGKKVDAKLLKPEDVQAELNRQPWSVEKHPDYLVEKYWWYGLPHKNYVTVLYYIHGDNVRFHTHYLNDGVHAEDLPGAKLSETDKGSKTGAPPTTGDTNTDKNTDKPSTGSPSSPSSDKPADDAPALDKPATETPASETPAPETPAEE